MDLDEKLIQFILIISCLFGCMWQTWDALTLYFRYPTNWDISFERPEYVTLPAISICFPTIFNQSLPQVKDRDALTVQEFADRTFSFERYLIECSLLLPN